MIASDEFPKLTPDEEMYVMPLSVIIQGDYVPIVQMFAMVLQTNTYCSPGVFFRLITKNDIPCIVREILLELSQKNMTAILILLGRAEGMCDYANRELFNVNVADNLRMMLKLACIAADAGIHMNYERFTIFSDEYLIGRTKTLKHYKELTQELFDIEVVKKELMNDS